MASFKGIRYGLLFLPFLSLLSACSNTPQFGATVSDIFSGDSYEIEVNLTVSTGLNPNQAGRPSPLVIQVFQLIDDTKFLQADIEKLLSNAEAELGASLVKSDQTLAFPGKNQEYELDVNSDAKYLGVVAAFQKEGGVARQIIDIEGRWSRDLCIELANTSLAKANRC
jgi:type VI secretion system protein VasD